MATKCKSDKRKMVGPKNSKTRSTKLSVRGAEGPPMGPPMGFKKGGTLGASGCAVKGVKKAKMACC